jgi:hypothetical protein
MPTYQQYSNLIQASLTDELRNKKYRGSSNPLRGHCYVAAEALYHLIGGKDSGYIPTTLSVNGDTHWFLQRVVGSRAMILDPTMGQFEHLPMYISGRGRGFLTKQPSKRALKVIKAVYAELAKGTI